MLTPGPSAATQRPHYTNGVPTLSLLLTLDGVGVLEVGAMSLFWQVESTHTSANIVELNS